MQYLKNFCVASESSELEFILSKDSYMLDMSCYSKNNAYPFHIFPQKSLRNIEFEPITIFYGTNGSGKSTLLNIIAQKLLISRSAPFNDTPLFPIYLELCSYNLCDSFDKIPQSSEIITSDGVFDFLLDIRAINNGIDRERSSLFSEYAETVRDCRENGWQMRDLDEYEELCRRMDARKLTKSKYVSKKMSATPELQTKSNGESAYLYFTHKIKEKSLYLLDEPENSLSPALQRELAAFLEESVRFYGCQLIISTHSPFLLALKNAKIYDLDTNPVKVSKWSDLPGVRTYYELFSSHKNDFL